MGVQLVKAAAVCLLAQDYLPGNIQQNKPTARCRTRDRQAVIYRVWIGCYAIFIVTVYISCHRATKRVVVVHVYLADAIVTRPLVREAIRITIGAGPF